MERSSIEEYRVEVTGITVATGEDGLAVSKVTAQYVIVRDAPGNKLVFAGGDSAVVADRIGEVAGDLITEVAQYLNQMVGFADEAVGVDIDEEDFLLDEDEEL